jgi:signal transduction histidine kinase
VADGLLAGTLCILCLISFVTARRTPEQPRGADALGAVLVLVAAGSLAARRRWPMAVLVLAAGATVALYGFGYPDSGLPLVVLIALYTVAANCDRRITVAATAALALAVVVVVAPSSGMDGGTLAGTLAVFTMAAVWGDRKKVQDAYHEQLELREVAKERERIEAARRAVSEERLRIARELHDVVAHSMSVIAVQSGVGAHVIDTRPEEAKRILQTISDTSRASLDEMRRLLGVLRSDPAADVSLDGALDATLDGPVDAPLDAPVGASGVGGDARGQGAAAGGMGGLAPAPGLGLLDELVGRVTAAGVPVEASVQGERGEVPAGVDLAAYRIVQEALTNVVKHAGMARASVVVRYEPRAVHVEVLDDGRGAGTSTVARTGSGHGLVGMRERAALYDGQLQAGPRVGGGYRVAATLRYAPS